MVRRLIVIMLLFFSYDLKQNQEGRSLRTIASSMRDRSSVLKVPHTPSTPRPKREDMPLKLSIEEIEKWAETDDELYPSQLFAVRSNDFSDKLGEVVSVHDGFTFYRGDFHPQSYRTRLNKMSGDLEPLVAVIHLGDINPSQKVFIEKNGFSSYYYHETVKILSVRSSQENLFKDYERLKEMKLNPELESIGPRLKNF